MLLVFPTVSGLFVQVETAQKVNASLYTCFWHDMGSGRIIELKGFVLCGIVSSFSPFVISFGLQCVVLCCFPLFRLLHSDVKGLIQIWDLTVCVKVLSGLG